MDNHIPFIIEVLYFVALIGLQLWIYIRTKNVHSLSKHPGIGYFRKSFIAFAAIYVLRLLILNIRPFETGASFGLIDEIDTSAMFLIIYFSILSVFYLAASFMWRIIPFALENILPIAALCITVPIYFIHVPLLIPVCGALVLITLVLKALTNYLNKKQHIFSSMFFIYALLLVFWLFDLVPQIQLSLSVEFKLIGYGIAILIFIFINYKIKRVLSDE